MAKEILILTNSGDLHADIIESLLEEKGHPPIRLNLDTFPRDYMIHQQMMPGNLHATLTHLPTGSVVDFSRIGAIWARKNASFQFLSDDLSPQEKAFADKEATHVLNGLLYALDGYWMSHPVAVRQAQWKAEQSIRALNMGFNLPNSLITNAPKLVKEFRARVHHKMITKVMSDTFLAANDVEFEQLQVHGMSTTLVTDEHMQSIDAVREIPCYFQEYIPKQFELRVTVIGNQVFCARIDSQQDARTEIDYRDFSADIGYEAFDLPSDVEQRCLAFVHSYGLQFGAIDLIVTPSGDYVFLENNPVGQFWFVEQLVPELRMMDAVAECLIKGAKCDH